MLRVPRATIVAIVLGVGLISASTAQAGPLLSWFFPDDGPQPAYSPLRYWTPAVGRAYDHFHGLKLNVYPPDRHPEIQPNWIILPYPHPPVEPAATLIEPPSPPPESKFRYSGTRD